MHRGVDPVSQEPKVFVGQAPVEATQEDIFKLFSQYGNIKNCILMTGPDGRSKGAAMVIYDKWAEVELAVEAENGTMNLGGGKPMVVRIADPPKRDGPLVGIAPKKLFVGQIPPNTTEDGLRDLFSPYGTIVELALLKKNPGAACAFVTYERWAHCEAAIEAHNGKTQLDGAKMPLMVKFADAKTEGGGGAGSAIGKRSFNSMDAGGGSNKKQFSGMMGGGGMMMGGMMAPGMGFGGGYGMGGGSMMPQGGIFDPMVGGMNPMASMGMMSSPYGMGGGGMGMNPMMGMGMGGMGMGGMISGSSMGGGMMGGGGGMMSGSGGGGMGRGSSMGGRGMGGGGRGGARGMGAGVSMDDTAKQWKLFIGQVPFEASETDLWPIFSEHGNILELVVLRNPQGRSRGCGFVIYENRMMAEKAIQQVDGKIYLPNDAKQRVLIVKFATPGGGGSSSAAMGGGGGGGGSGAMMGYQQQQQHADPSGIMGMSGSGMQGVGGGMGGAMMGSSGMQAGGGMMMPDPQQHAAYGQQQYAQQQYGQQQYPQQQYGQYGGAVAPGY